MQYQQQLPQWPSKQIPLKKTEKVAIIREVQAMLATGVSQRQIARALKIARNSVSKYAKGNPEYLAEENSRAFSSLHPFQREIVRLVNEGHFRKDVCEHVTNLGYTGKITQFYEYCRFLVADGLIEPPVKLQRNQLLDIASKQKYHYVTRHQLFRFMWSKHDDVNESDWE